MKTVLLFANAIAGRGRGKRIAASLRRTLATRGYLVHAVLDRPESVSDESLRSIEKPVAVISIGGDGTLRAVAQRIFDVFGPSEMPPLAVVPLGTANLMSKHLGATWREPNVEAQVADAIDAGRFISIDAATANGKLFLLMAGIGIDAQIVHELDRVRDGPIDLTSYALPAALALQSYSFSPVTVIADGRRAFGPAPALVFVGNVPEYGTGFPVLPLARSDDGVLDVCILPCATRLDLLRLFMQVATGDHLRAEGVIYATAKQVTIESQSPLPVQIDGDPAGHTPLAIELLATRIPFLIA